MHLWNGVWGHDHTVLDGVINFINSKYSAAEKYDSFPWVHCYSQEIMALIIIVKNKFLVE